MNNIFKIAPFIFFLSGCWFDSAPEVYSVEIAMTDTAGLATGNSVQICDFRGQTATRQCALNLQVSDDHLMIAASGPYKSDIEALLQSADFKRSPVATALSMHQNIDLRVIISAHGRKENRYNLTIDGESPWELLEQTTAVMDDGRKSYILSDAELREGKQLTFNANPSEYIQSYSEQYNLEMNRTFSCYTGDPNGCKLTEFVSLQPQKAYSQATLSITWTPLDEDDLSKTDKVS